MGRNMMLLIGAILIAGGAVYFFAGNTPESGGGQAMVDVKVPPLNTTTKLGERLFNENCASCHGKNAAGQTGVAPPLVHKIYEPGHHADGSFLLAVQRGVRAHHWTFGNMPKVEGLTNDDVTKIVEYVRLLQRANGIR